MALLILIAMIFGEVPAVSDSEAMVKFTDLDTDGMVALRYSPAGIIAIRDLAATKEHGKRTCIEFSGSRYYLVKESAEEVCKSLGL